MSNQNLNVDILKLPGENVSVSPGGLPALLIIPNQSVPAASADAWAHHFTFHFETYLLKTALPDENLISDFAANLALKLRELRTRRLSLLGIGRGTTAVQALSVIAPKLVRRIVLLNAHSRLAPSAFQRAIDRIESFLPLGLPLRPLSKAYDSRPYLHRIHCPTLLLTSTDASPYEIEQSAIMSERIPNCWVEKLNDDLQDNNKALSPALVQLLRDFAEIPVKCPQKNIPVSEQTPLSYAAKS